MSCSPRGNCVEGESEHGTLTHGRPTPMHMMGHCVEDAIHHVLRFQFCYIPAKLDGTVITSFIYADLIMSSY